MSVYLFDSNTVLLDGTSVATDEACCCGVDTGACCLCDGTCESVTETQCNDDGGVFQGIGTICGSVVCCPCPCGFEDFLGGGTYYLTKTYTVSREAHSATESDCSETNDYVTTKTITPGEDCSCAMDTSCSGTQLFSRPFAGACSLSPYDWVYDASTAHGDTGWASGCHLINDGFLCHCESTGPCGDCGLVVVTATFEQCTCTFDDGMGNTENITVTATLSEPYPCFNPC